MPRVVPVTTEDFSREVLFSPVPVVVDVYTDLSSRCRAHAPLLERYAEIYAGAVRFLKVDADADPDVVHLYRVEVLPTLLLFKAGREIDRVVGVPLVPAMTAKLDALAGRSSRGGGCCG